MHGHRFHPGAYLRELMIWHDLSAEELAREMHLPDHAVVELTRARRNVDRAISERLAGYFGNSAQFWLDLQRGFDRQAHGDGQVRGGANRLGKNPPIGIGGFLAS